MAVRPVMRNRFVSLITVRAIEEKRDTAGSQASSSPDMMSSEQLAKLAELRRARADAAPAPSGNLVTGALEEAQLISWPTPGKALLDTVLVLAIVAATGSLLFGLNVLLADASTWWYNL
jgi:preprotein translocase subunit SecE